MEKIFYAADAYVSTYGQGADLIIIKSPEGTIYGAACEFDICTKDITKVSIQQGETFDASDKKFEEAEWLEYTDDIGTTPAGWEDIVNAGLSDFVSGYQLESEVVIHRFKK
ncbi:MULTISPECIES: hypothetical protein [Pseudomonas]|jgi:hypothetical protein|uniref:ASCH domain-containing protein n=1 Tax=Pseudomonas mandelii TaxID=75612 RepID=A0ABY0VW60_9PSED|nr:MULTISPECIES: hypothetical protein [Pseudomonas]OOL36197.1 hypothetical protein BOO94_19230 [Pseudomonas sp. FSL W5-0299]OYP98425.1 hypothetical protein B7L09_29500 [Pseudomonas mandelii]QQN96841.1 hypothetical protein JIO00_18170 [Pseudomonas sp. SW-3]TWS09566.1 hypothetical protein FJD35_14565 [Pseudomonas mandelii]SDU59282.1 hypothetical protein SAMN04489801_4837 [Pseudomonas mandelii]